MGRFCRQLWLLGALTCAIAFGFPPSASSAQLSPRASAPPTTAQVREATERFLADHPAPRSAPWPAATASGTGGSEHDTGGTGAGPGPETEIEAELPELPTVLFPSNRVVALYGAPQLTATIIGRRSPKRATMKLRRQARAYADLTRPVIRAFDLIAVIATASPGPDGKYRSRQSDEIIGTYLKQARKLDGRLVLDLQPARAHLMAEIKALRPWLLEPDVDLIIDAEWMVGRKGIPGRTLGSIRAKELNRASRYVQRLIEDEGLPPKLLAVHHFTGKNIRGRNKIVSRDDVQVTLNFDGIGSRSGKTGVYEALSTEATDELPLFNGFSLFYRLDSGLMKPEHVTGLTPVPDFVMYQ